MRQKVLATNNSLLAIILITTTSYLSKHVCGQIVCDSACLRGIDDTYDYAASIHRELTSANDNLLQRVLKLENEEVGVIGEINILARRVGLLESNLASNVSTLHKRISDEVEVIYQNMNDMVTRLEIDLLNRLGNLTALVNGYHGGGNTGSGSLSDLFTNLTKRIDALEYGKVYNLSVDNQIWRRNFRVINSTFSRIKNNNCVC